MLRRKINNFRKTWAAGIPETQRVPSAHSEDPFSYRIENWLRSEEQNGVTARFSPLQRHENIKHRKVDRPSELQRRPCVPPCGEQEVGSLRFQTDKPRLVTGT